MSDGLRISFLATALLHVTSLLLVNKCFETNAYFRWDKVPTSISFLKDDEVKLIV